MNIRTCWSYHRKSDIFASGIALRVCARRNLPCRVAIRLTKAVTSTYDENEIMIDGDRIGEKATKRRELIIISQKPVVVIKELKKGFVLQNTPILFSIQYVLSMSPVCLLTWYIASVFWKHSHFFIQHSKTWIAFGTF